MPGRRSAPELERETTEAIEPSPRTRRRTSVPDEPSRGRRLFRRQQKDRQGTEPRGSREPTPRDEPGSPYVAAHTSRPRRGGAKGKRLAWGLGSLTAAAGVTGAWLFRRNARDRRRRRAASLRR